MSATDEEWLAALDAARHGRPRAYCDMRKNHGWPPIDFIDAENELLMRLQGKEPSSTAMDHADAFEEFQRLELTKGYREARRIICEKYGFDPIKKTLDNLMAKKRSDVNPILRQRGLI